MSDIERLRRALKCAATIAATKRVLDQTCALLKAVASTRDFALLDGLTEMRFNCTRRMGELLLAGAERVPGVDADIAEQCCKRARLADSEFAALVSKAQFMQRRRAGEPPSPRAAQRSGAEPQARTLRSPWRLEDGFPTRYIVGVDLKRYREMIAAGGDIKKIEVELLAEVLRAA